MFCEQIHATQHIQKDRLDFELRKLYAVKINILLAEISTQFDQILLVGQDADYAISFEQTAQ